MLWTGMGFTILITALSIEMYFMMNAFWTKAVINYKVEPQNHFSDSDKTYNFFLTNLSEFPKYHATLSGAFRCALSNLVAFSAIIGRAGPLEALFVTVLGTIGYELNRQILENYSRDAGGSSSIFVFGGFFGLAIGLFRFLKERGDNNTIRHDNYTANRSSASFALIGSVLVWIFFPVLSMDYIAQEVSISTPYTSMYSVIFALCAATLTSFMLSPLFNNGIQIRDIIYGPIAGGVASVTASYWVVNPAYSLVIGVVSAAIQVIVMNLIEKRVANEMSIFNTYSFTLFGAQGLVGAIFAAIWQAGLRTNDYGFVYTMNSTQIFAWVISLISAAMGLAFGIGAGVLVFLVASHRREDHFDDFPYWINDDGIRTFRDKEIDKYKLFIKEKNSEVKGRRTYL